MSIKQFLEPPAALESESSSAVEMPLAERESPENEARVQSPALAIDVNEAKRALEAVLLAASEPMEANELRRIFDGELSVDTVRNLLEELRDEWKGRSAELSRVASGYRFRVRPEFQRYLDRTANEKPPRYSRAVLETLAIIAYRQPVTRADIEEIRGVSVSPHILKTLEDRGWIDEIGHRNAPGRPALFGTTKHFLDDLNLRSLDELPPLHELQATLDMNGVAQATGNEMHLSLQLDSDNTTENNSSGSDHHLAVHGHVESHDHDVTSGAELPAVSVLNSDNNLAMDSDGQGVAK